MKKKIFELIKKYPIKNIENAFVQSFIKFNHLTIKNNKLLLDIVKDDSDITNTIKSKIVAPKNIYELENVFELLIPQDDRKLNGAFFTPPIIANYISNELIKTGNEKICDPSCGCGAFLIAAIEVIKNKFNKPVIEIIEENIYGFDILEYSVRRCKIILSILALLNNQDLREIHFNIFCQNSLNFNWPQFFEQFNIQNGFDIVVGNPPYVKYQDLSQSVRQNLPNNWKTIKVGNYNLYFAFFELGINILKKRGKLGYIVPNNYFTSISGINLRIFLQSNKFIEKIIDFNHLKIFESQTYTCITFLSKQKNDYFLFDKIYDKCLLSNLSNLNFSKCFFDDLNMKKWRLLRTCDFENIKRIESLEYKLGNLFNIKVGIATCKDELYFLNEDSEKNNYYIKTYNNQEYLIEKEVTRKISKISDFSTQKIFENNKRRIIFPYTINNNKAVVIDEESFKLKYPKCYKYLLAIKEELSARDKGKGLYPAWYAYARTQGLNFYGQKLLTPTFSEEPRFLFDSDPTSLFCNGYAIYQKTDLQMTLLNKKMSFSVLQKILNSQVMDYYVRTTSVCIDGGYPCYQKNFIELFGIPAFEDEEIKFLESENSEIKINEFLKTKYQLLL